MVEDFPQRIARLEAENKRLRELLDEVLDTAMERWHDAPIGYGPEPAHQWIGLTEAEYAAWVERKPPFAALSDPPPGGGPLVS